MQKLRKQAYEYRPKGGNALRLGVKADMVLFVDNTV